MLVIHAWVSPSRPQVHPAEAPLSVQRGDASACPPAGNQPATEF